MRNSAVLEQLGISPSLIAERGLSPRAEAEILEVVEVSGDGSQHLLVPEAAAAWRHLKETATSAGVTLFIVSAFRSVERQVEIVRRKLDQGQDIKDILCVSAPPGFSEHHTGRAIDIGTPGTPVLQERFDQTPAYAWLQQHAESFGFKLSYPVGNPYGYRYEPWHWCYGAGQQAVPPDGSRPAGEPRR